MKKFIIYTVAFFALCSFYGPNAVIEWNFIEHNFGKIERHEPVTVEFTFKNPGMMPLVVTDVKSSCGCTVPEYPKEPIPPQGEGEIVVTYDAKVSGYFSKTISVYTNTAEGVTQLFIKGEVN